VKRRITLVEGDITEQQVDAVVNAANSALLLGAGVAGAIRSKGGPSIQEECNRLSPIGVGEAVLTGAGELPARYVIHAAGMALGGDASEESVRASVRRSFEIASEQGFRTLACPAVGAGIGSFSMQRCAEVCLEEARRCLAGDTSLEEIRFVLFGEPAYRVFRLAAAEREALRIKRHSLGMRSQLVGVPPLSEAVVCLHQVAQGASLLDDPPLRPLLSAPAIVTGPYLSRQSIRMAGLAVVQQFLVRLSPQDAIAD